MGSHACSHLLRSYRWCCNGVKDLEWERALGQPKGGRCVGNHCVWWRCFCESKPEQKDGFVCS